MKNLILTIIITISLSSIGFASGYQVGGISNSAFPPPVLDLAS